MIKIEDTEVWGWKGAIRGMRNPMNSWEKSDSLTAWGKTTVGKNDLQLMKNLVAAGSDHSKFMRMINVTLDITAPLYWWKEFDTYKVGTVRNSCSTMHKIHTKQFSMEDFSVDNFVVDEYLSEIELSDMFVNVIVDCEELRQRYNETGDKKYWRGLIQLLPSSYNQRATVQLNYAVLRAMYHARKMHRLDEWRTFCEWIESLPYAELITAESKPKPETRWIPCSERMPLPGLTVHVFAVQNDGCEMFFDAYYSEGAGIWSTYDSTAKESDRFSHAVSPLIKITHWMPIADKPEGV